MQILSAPNKFLNIKSEDIKNIDRNIKKIVSEMAECLDSQKDPQGVGLAAPQVGLNVRLFISKPTPTSKRQVFINPRIIGFFDKKIPDGKRKGGKRKLEGCLSIPRIWAPIKRKYGVKIEYMDLKGKIYTKKFTGYQSIIIQHEIDHLEGILFTQRALEQKAQMFEEKGEKLVKIELQSI